MNRFLAAVSLASFALLTACGGEDTKSADASGAPSSNSEATSSDVRATGHATKKLTCDADGLSVQVKQNGADVTISWSGKPSTAGADFTSYITTLTTADGKHSVQAGKKIYTSGNAPTQYLWDMSQTNQEDLEANGEQVDSIEFPGALKTVGDGWSAKAVVNIDGNDTITCA